MDPRAADGHGPALKTPYFTITWLTNGQGTRYTGIELFDSNMNFLRQIAHAGGHMDVTRDTNGDEVMIWASGGDPWPQTSCGPGIVKIRLADATQMCLFTFYWGLADHISATDNSGWFFVATYAPSDPIPPSGWSAYTNELIQIKLDGTEVRRFAHHRSRPLDSYTWEPKVSVSRDGRKLAYGSNFGLEQILGYPQHYADAYFIDISVISPDTVGTASSP